MQAIFKSFHELSRMKFKYKASCSVNLNVEIAFNCLYAFILLHYHLFSNFLMPYR